MKFIHYLLTLLKTLMFIAIFAVNLYFGWLILASLWGVFSSKPDGFEILGKSVVNFFVYNLAVGFVFAIVSASVRYLEDKLNRI